MKIRVIAFLLFLLTAFSGFSQNLSDELGTQDEDWYIGRPIRDITLSGLKNVSNSELEAIINPYRGRLYSDIVFLELQGKLYALEYFERIETSIIRTGSDSNEVIIRFSVTERPIIGRITFSGNSGIRRNDLSDTISIKSGDVLNHAKLRNDLEALRTKYIEKGYPNATITAEENSTQDGIVNILFRIIEREKLSISKIEFQGNNRFSSNTLRSQLSSKAKTLINDGAFQEAKLIEDKEAIAKYYHDRGYIDAFVRDVTRSFEIDNKGNNNMILTFYIDEGTEFKFGGVTFEGNRIFSTEQLEKLISSKIGDTVNATKLEMDLQRVADLYFENGYIFNSIIRTPDKNYQTNIISYHISIVERSRAYIENIIILGNEKTRTDVILREIPLEPGDVFSKTKVMDAMRNLYNLQFFSMVIPDTLQGSSENLMDLVFSVEETLTTDLQFGLTFSGSADPDSWPISGMIEWNDRNFRGTGNQVGAKVNTSIIESNVFEANYNHRWFLGLPLSLGVDFTAEHARRYATMNNQFPIFNGDELYAFPDGFYSYEEYFNFDRWPPNEYLLRYNQWYLSLGLSTGYRWQTLLGILSVGGGMRFGIVRNSYDETLYRPFDPALRDRNNQWTPKNSFWLSTSLDNRDIFYDPSRGMYLQARGGFYGILPNEREHYVRLETKAQYFFTLFNIPVTEKWSFKAVIGVHGALTTIHRQPGRGNENGLPRIEDANKLAIDGMFNARGWSDEYRFKSLILLDTWVELRIPIVHGLLALDTFFDMAGVENNHPNSQLGLYFGRKENGDPNFTVDNLRFSFGTGLRFALPQFPIRLSIAKRFKFVDGEFQWMRGAIGGRRRENGGVDIVFSFIMSY